MAAESARYWAKARLWDEEGAWLGKEARHRESRYSNCRSPKELKHYSDC